MPRYLIYILIACCIVLQINCSPQDDLTNALKALKTQRSLKGMQVQISKNKEIVYNLNLGQKNQVNQPIDNNTMFRIASVSKSFASVAIMQLVQLGKLSLNQSLSQIFGYKISNPFFPDVEITVEMILSHQSSLIECEPYYSNFLDATYNAKSGSDVPNIKQILLKGGKYYSDCLFSKTYKPGSYYQYVNLNFGIAGTIVQILTKIRYDEYTRYNILNHISQGLTENATFNPATINNPKNLGVIYIGQSGKWVPSCDNYPGGVIPQRNLTGYKIGDNGVIYGPQGSLRASVSHLTNYAIMLSNGGKTKLGRKVLSQESVKQILKPRYQYHGKMSGSKDDFHTYGFGIFTTTYRVNDILISHEVVKGHTGSAYNLISAQYFWGGYTLTYIVNGALNGYKSSSTSIYEYERVAIHTAAQHFINAAKSVAKISNLIIE